MSVPAEEWTDAFCLRKQEAIVSIAIYRMIFKKKTGILLTYVNDNKIYFGYNLNNCSKIKGGSHIKVYDFYNKILCLENKELLKELVAVTKTRYLKKGEYIVHIDEIINEVYFLVTGISRGYYLGASGKDITDCFSFQCGTTAMPFAQMELNVPSPLAIEILEEGTFFCIPISTVVELQKKYLEITLFYNQLLVKALNEHWRLKQVLNQYTATQRYQWFLKEYPGLIYRVKDRYIASFLGMTPVTLSRLRKTLKEEQKVAECIRL